MATVDDNAGVEMKLEEGSRRSNHPHVWYIGGAYNKSALLSATVNIHLQRSLSPDLANHHQLHRRDKDPVASSTLVTLSSA
jgi:hypothetical protein